MTDLRAQAEERARAIAMEICTRDTYLLGKREITNAILLAQAEACDRAAERLEPGSGAYMTARHEAAQYRAAAKERS